MKNTHTKKGQSHWMEWWETYSTSTDVWPAKSKSKFRGKQVSLAQLGKFNGNNTIQNNHHLSAWTCFLQPQNRKAQNSIPNRTWVHFLLQKELFEGKKTGQKGSNVAYDNREQFTKKYSLNSLEGTHSHCMIRYLSLGATSWEERGRRIVIPQLMFQVHHASTFSCF